MSEKLFRRMAFVAALIVGLVVVFSPYLRIEGVIGGVIMTIIVYLFILKTCRPPSLK